MSLPVFKWIKSLCWWVLCPCIFVRILGLLCCHRPLCCCCCWYRAYWKGLLLYRWESFTTVACCKAYRHREGCPVTCFHQKPVEDKVTSGPPLLHLHSIFHLLVHLLIVSLIKTSTIGTDMGGIRGQGVGGIWPSTFPGSILNPCLSLAPAPIYLWWAAWP